MQISTHLHSLSRKTVKLAKGPVKDHHTEKMKNDRSSNFANIRYFQDSYTIFVIPADYNFSINFFRITMT